MKSVCEITTPSTMAYIRFNDQNKDDVKKVEEILTELADDGLVCAVGFHQEQ